MIHSALYLKAYHEEEFILAKKREYLVSRFFCRGSRGFTPGLDEAGVAHSVAARAGKGRVSGRRFYMDIKKVITDTRHGENYLPEPLFKRDSRKGYLLQCRCWERPR
jgi:hypothetical protein